MFFEDASYKWSLDIVGKFCGIPVPDWGEFRNFNHLKGKFSTGGTVRRAGRYQRWLRAPAGRVETKELFPGRLDVGIAAAEAGFRFRADQSRGRRMLGTYAAPEAAAAAEAAAESCGELRRWDRPSTGSTDLVVRLTLARRHLW